MAPEATFWIQKYKRKKQKDNPCTSKETARLVKEAFELFATGNYSLKTLSEVMYEKGLKTKYGWPFSPESMKRLLKRKFYIGKLIWHGREYKGRDKPIIEKELFYQVQEVLKRRREGEM